MIWRTRRQTWDLSTRGLLMGILNVTPDSFSDGGRYATPEEAGEWALQMIADGADVVDIGGESTRPGAEAVSAAEEWDRVGPVLEWLRPRTEAALSIDTSKADVARAAIDTGVDILNDVTGFQDDAMVEAARRSECGVVIMHMRGNPRTMQREPEYEDVVRDVGNFLRHRRSAVLASGLNPDSIVLDPGIGFGKTPEHNRMLLAATGALSELGAPLLIGLSRKSFLSAFTDQGTVSERIWPALALTSFCREHGARIFRVHDVRAHRDALRMTEVILNGVPDA